MNIMIYAGKRNFDVQKAERYFKERRVPYTSVDLKKHKPGARELKLFAQAAGSAKALVDQSAKGERADYVKQLTIESVIFDELLEHPELLRTPIVRNGNAVTFGDAKDVWDTWK